MQRAATALAMTVAGVFVSLNLYAIVAAVEDWPFTNAPMFAHYVDRNTPRYRFAFEATFSDESTKRIHYAHANLRWMSLRYFFKYVYGSVEEHSPFNIYPQDTPEAFEERLGEFFSVLSTRITTSTKTVRSIDLLLIPLAWEDNSEGEPILVGSFSADRNTFTHRYVHAH